MTWARTKRRTLNAWATQVPLKVFVFVAELWEEQSGMWLVLRDDQSQGSSNSLRCFPTSLSYAHAHCSSLLYVSCFFPNIATFHMTGNISMTPVCSYFITSLPCGDWPSLCSNLKTPNESSFWSIVDRVTHPLVFCLLAPPKITWLNG